MALFVKVLFGGKKHNYYFGETPKLVELDQRGNETETVVTEFEESALEGVQVFDAEYVHTLRDESAGRRETIQSVLKEMGIEEVTDVTGFMEAYKEALGNQKTGDDGDDSDAIKQLKAFLEEKDNTILSERENNKKAVTDALAKWKRAVKDHALLQAVAIPKAIKPGEVKLILERFVDVDDEGSLHVYEDAGFKRKRLSPSGAAMTVDELATDYYDKNPHHIEGHSAGGGSGSDGLGEDGTKIDPNLPASERLKQFRQGQAAGQK